LLLASVGPRIIERRERMQHRAYERCLAAHHPLREQTEGSLMSRDVPPLEIAIGSGAEIFAGDEHGLRKLFGERD